MPAGIERALINRVIKDRLNDWVRKNRVTSLGQVENRIAFPRSDESPLAFIPTANLPRYTIIFWDDRAKAYRIMNLLKQTAVFDSTAIDYMTTHPYFLLSKEKNTDYAPDFTLSVFPNSNSVNLHISPLRDSHLQASPSQEIASDTHLALAPDTVYQLRPSPQQPSLLITFTPRGFLQSPTGKKVIPQMCFSLM